jgi:hypothetical protein
MYATNCQIWSLGIFDPQAGIPFERPSAIESKI